MDEINAFNAIPANKTHAHARVVADGPVVVDTTTLGLSVKDRLDLVKVTLEPESLLGELDSSSVEYLCGRARPA